MPLSKKKIRSLLEKYKKDFDDFELYDKTREWLIGRKRIDITLSKKVIKKLKELKEKTGKPFSRIIEDALLKI